MNCSKCNSPLGAGQYCSTCGLKHEYILKACNTADYYYNQGLSKAQIRDLFGAREDLLKSLHFNKYHIDARNLLGLIYFETGEAVEAMKHWVISINFEPENNPAQRYLNEIQADNYIETIRQVVKKYNLALQYAGQGSEDLALIQVKKVLSMTPNFINASLLLALLDMHAGRSEEALETLEGVLKIDRFHPQAVRYYQDLTGEIPLAVSGNSEVTVAKPEEKKVKMPDLSRYMDTSKGNSHMVLSVVIGIVIGVVVMWVLIMPNQRFNVSSDYKALQTEYNDTVAAKDATISQLEEEKASLEEENKTLTDRLEVYAGTDGEDGMYDAILKASSLYASGDTVEAAKALLDVDEDRLESDTAKEIYSTLKDNTFVSASNSLYTEGKSTYDNYRYDDARKLLKDAYKLNKDNSNALYFLGRCYQRLGNNDKAKETYEKVISKFPGTTRASDATKKLAEMGYTVETTEESTEE
ncbi:MAG: tetratricopeptide repeat protein [Lachnospiraceae bacterium]|nr:tetratricopeptide repeat protein [Lachnospiraceae bacterium]